jgi:hypothetical protein
LSIGILIAMRIGFNTMEKVDSRLVSDRRVSYARRILENEIAGYTYVTAAWQMRRDVFQPVPFYQFEPQTMRFVTTYSLTDAWRGRPQIAAFQVIPGDQGRGVRLIVNETPFAGPVQAGEMISGVEPGAPPSFFPVIPGPRSFVLADRLSYCRFMYLEALTKAPFQLWRPDWVAPQQLPLGIRVEMAPLDSSPADLHVSAVTVAFNVNRTPGLVYEDKP